MKSIIKKSKIKIKKEAAITASKKTKQTIIYSTLTLPVFMRLPFLSDNSTQ